MELMSFVNENVLFHGNVDLDKILLFKNQINGVSTISGDIILESGTSALNINDNGIHMTSDNGFEVRTKDSDKLIFPIDFSSFSIPTIPSLALPGGAKDVNKIRSPSDQDLNIRSQQKIKIRGNEGIDLESKRISFNGSSIFMSSIKGSIILDSKQGIHINTKIFENIIHPNKDQQSGDKQLQYKLCVCGKTGRIFQIQLRHPSHGCADIRFPESANPCA
ncbi:beta-sarcoglycan-like [Oppia nitens]|uniref:beta-sarcoglycan-like n=1 Tax=Oppia nitens TaxID=1686743 RepID=UPI0023DB1FFE|nr:beta-sarcoglycan-like [Oppia nitens]